MRLVDPCGINQSIKMYFIVLYTDLLKTQDEKPFRLDRFRASLRWEKSLQILSTRWRCKVKPSKPWYRNKCHQTSFCFLHLSNGICMDPREAAASWLQNLSSVRRQPAKSLVRDQGTFAAYSLASWHPWVNSGLTEVFWKQVKRPFLFFGLFRYALKQWTTLWAKPFDKSLFWGYFRLQLKQSFWSFLDLITLPPISANILWTEVSEEKTGRKSLGLQAVVHLNFQSDPVFWEAELWGAPGGRSRLLSKVLNARQRWSSLHAGADASFHGATLTLFHYL